MNKEEIIAEIRRTAQENGGVALGIKRFEDETGISHYDWSGFWCRWGDAIREAGFKVNRMNEGFDDAFVLEKLIVLTRRLGHVPSQNELIFASKNEASFPNEKVFRRFGVKAQRASKVLGFCDANPGYEDVASLWKLVLTTEQPLNVEQNDSVATTVGYVYLLKHGVRPEYKIGRTNNPVRREGEVRMQLPEKLEPVHYIKTDDPAGIENYWHNRFASKRKEGEWFSLSAQDVRAFKRWKRIY